MNYPKRMENKDSGVDDVVRVAFDLSISEMGKCPEETLSEIFPDQAFQNIKKELDQNKVRVCHNQVYHWAITCSVFVEAEGPGKIERLFLDLASKHGLPFYHPCDYSQGSNGNGKG